MSSAPSPARWTSAGPVSRPMSITAAPSAPTAFISPSSAACIMRGAITSWLIRHRIWSSTSPRRRAVAVCAASLSNSVQSIPSPRAPTRRPSASSRGPPEHASITRLPSIRFSQARRRLAGTVRRNGLNALGPAPPASSNSAGWPISVAVGQPNTGSGARKMKRPEASVSKTMSAAVMTRSRQRWRLSSSARRRLTSAATGGPGCRGVISFMNGRSCPDDH
jgi:hypothetical protein